jgi:hypothetical protein
MPLKRLELQALNIVEQLYFCTIEPLNGAYSVITGAIGAPSVERRERSVAVERLERFERPELEAEEQRCYLAA